MKKIYRTGSPILHYALLIVHTEFQGPTPRVEEGMGLQTTNRSQAGPAPGSIEIVPHLPQSWVKYSRSYPKNLSFHEVLSHTQEVLSVPW